MELGLVAGTQPQASQTQAEPQYSRGLVFGEMPGAWAQNVWVSHESHGLDPRGPHAAQRGQPDFLKEAWVQARVAK